MSQGPGLPEADINSKCCEHEDRKNQRSFSYYIPRSSIPTYLLEAIDKGKVND